VTTKENRQGANLAAECLTGGPDDSSLTANRATSPDSAAKIGATVETQLDAALVRLVANDIALDDLTPALQGFYLAGHAAALAAVLPELTRAEQTAEHANADADRLYGLAFFPREPIKVGPSYKERESIRGEIYGGTR
jgi:hypothetical protein